MKRIITILLATFISSPLYADCSITECENVVVTRVYIEGGNLMMDVDNDATACAGSYVAIESFDGQRLAHRSSRNNLERASNNSSIVRFTKEDCKIRSIFL